GGPKCIFTRMTDGVGRGERVARRPPRLARTGLLAAVLALLAGCAQGQTKSPPAPVPHEDIAEAIPKPEAVPAPPAAKEPPKELPRGGRTIFPEYRLV